VSNEFDAIIIGSGFGGAVTACRLAARGMRRILVLERGREWTTDNYPWKSGHWIYDPEEPECRSGWTDLRLFRHMTVAQGAGVGGGSLIYANVSVKAKPELFAQGWPEPRYPRQHCERRGQRGGVNLIANGVEQPADRQNALSRA
jgi:cholesterol oxidase